MSTKIFNGYRLRCSNFTRLQAFLDEFRAKALEYFEYSYYTKLAEECALIVDSKTLGLKLEEQSRRESLYWASYDAVSKRYKKTKTSMERDPEYDFECNLSIHVAGGKYVYILLYAEMRGYETILNNMTGIEYYGYWDNTDPDSTVSERAFNARGKTWDRVLGESGTPMHRGMSFTIVGTELPMVSGKKIIDHMIPFEDRVSRMARKTSSDMPPKADGSAYTMNEILDYLLSDDYKRRVEQEKERIKLLLQPKITEDNFRNS
jgi:hypothetical protein